MRESITFVRPVQPPEPGPDEGGRTALDEGVRVLRGVGEQRAAQLKRLGVETLRDLVYCLPRTYSERPPISPVEDLRPDRRVAVAVKVLSSSVRRRRRGQRDLVARVGDATGELEVIWFHQPYLSEQLAAGTDLLLWGVVSRNRPLQMLSPEFELLPSTAPEPATSELAPPALPPMPEWPSSWNEGCLLPVYRLTDGLTQKQVRKLVREALRVGLPLIAETLPVAERSQHHLPLLGDALRMLHAPASTGELKRARERLVFDEFLELMLLLRRCRRQQDKAGLGRAKRGGARLRQAQRELPFQLTRAQRNALNDILQDMAAPRVMHRLLEGDVGSGKTVVALLAAVAAADAGYQTALMAPTEILAAQHAETVAQLLPMLRTGFLTGGRAAARSRRRTLGELATGETELVIGTQALFAADVRFHDLGLVIVDEQHRFGVGQRAALHAKGEDPDMLVMTATPIPRSLALTCYGDLDLTIIDQLPPGRTPARTHLAEPSHRERVMQYLDQRIGAGGQVVVIAPRIDATSNSDLIAATECLQVLRRHPQLGRRRIELLHGRLASEDKEAVMHGLYRGQIDLLVATSVVEVGLDVPGLAVVVIEHPERFGLSQLHQLRGRVGRRNRCGECILQLSEQTPAAARERLRYFARTQDGFQVATMDLELRGVGELLGHRQHGFDGLQIADLNRDRHLLKGARLLARRLLVEDPELDRHVSLRRSLDRRQAPPVGSASCSSEVDTFAG